LQFYGDTALTEASQGGHNLVVQLLVEAGANMDAKGKVNDKE
jgi:ankyrin repeat protein